MTKKIKTNSVQGEGDYEAGRRFQDAERAFVKKGSVELKAREAADALDGPQAAELEAARKTSARGGILRKSRPSQGVAAAISEKSDAHTESNLDHGLEETFPASDPVSISAGSD